MTKIFPEADIYCLVNFLSDKDEKNFNGAKIQTSFLQRIPFSKRFYKLLLPLMPFAAENHDLTGYDVIISSSHAVAKGVITTPSQLHICYCYTPVRYAWDLYHQYLRDSGFGPVRRVLAGYFLHKLRIWDLRTVNNVDYFVACSKYIGQRIWKTYRRTSDVIYPNVDTVYFSDKDIPRENFYMTASRMVPYKKVELIVEAFTKMPDKKLIVIGDGPQFRYAKSIATPNITLLGFQPGSVLLDHLQRCKAFLFAAEEDFGIAPIEAQACGAPVIAYGRGGARETVVDGATGLHFDTQTAEAIIDAIARFEGSAGQFDRTRIREQAEKFSALNFRHQMQAFIDEKWSEHKKSQSPGK
ncbi:glycosyltransferase [Methylobacterium sp. J-030]|uniref:glycosyltransferase n=1 Tax=Methylobacterium sp. J-030 TaxID=2836627 RepID=UPI001FB93B58|nr:glycosyltransferase [Methylobacterium sp. J-030]MCJ2068599.1 glycosyltransferase [Methylobacterium sp. J-030]